jgi:hypothetical protein
MAKVALGKRQTPQADRPLAAPPGSLCAGGSPARPERAAFGQANQANLTILAYPFTPAAPSIWLGDPEQPSSPNRLPRKGLRSCPGNPLCPIRAVPARSQRILENPCFGRVLGTGGAAQSVCQPPDRTILGQALRGCPEMGTRATARTVAKPFRFPKVPGGFGRLGAAGR